MELDPLKVPAFMRKKQLRKKSEPTDYFRPTEVPEKVEKPVAPDFPSFYQPPAPVQQKPKPRVRKKTKPIPFPKFTPTTQAKPKQAKEEKNMDLLGVVTDFLDNINVAIIKLGADVELGDVLLLPGESGSYKMKLKSMQLNRQQIGAAKRGQEIGMKVKKKVELGEMVYLIN